jgi:hypothetical protein
LIDVVYGLDIRNWQFSPEVSAQGKDGANPVWKGPQARWKNHWPGWGVRLSMMTWTNPLPDIKIKSLELISAMTTSAPFVIAITADPAEPNKD